MATTDEVADSAVTAEDVDRVRREVTAWQRAADESLAAARRRIAALEKELASTRRERDAAVAQTRRILDSRSYSLARRIAGVAALLRR